MVLAFAVAEPSRFPLQKMIEEALARKESVIRLPEGRFLIDTPKISVTGATNLRIEGSGPGTVILSPSPSNSLFGFFNSRGIVLKNFSISGDPLPFTQATVTGISENRLFFEYEIHKGYPELTPATALKTVYFFDAKTRLWKRDVPDVYVVSNTILSPTRGQLFKPTRPGNRMFDYSDIQVGDRLAFCIRGAGVVFRGCEDVRIEDVDILAAPGGVLCRYMRGENYFRFNIRRGPKPEGAVEEPLMASSADGFNYAVGTKGPVVERCDFSYMGDDSVNIHGTVVPVVAVESPTRFWITQRYSDSLAFFDMIEPGQHARLLKFGNFDILGDFPILSVTHDPGQTNRMTDEQVRHWSYASTSPGYFRDRNLFKYYRVDLKKPMTGLKAGDGFSVPELECPNYVIRGCYFHDHRAMGLRVQSGEGLIENNTFERVKYSAIQIGPEYYYWGETGWVQNVIIRSNRIFDVGYDQSFYSPYGRSMGALAIYTSRPAMDDKDVSAEILALPQVSLNSNLQITGNVIDTCALAGITVMGGHRIVIASNVIRNVNRKNLPTTGSVGGIQLRHDVSSIFSGEVRLIENRFENPGKDSKGNYKDYKDNAE